MLLVDNFRAFLLVGLICAAGIPSTRAQATKCIDPSDAIDQDCTTVTGTTHCKVGLDAKSAGCVDGATECPAGAAMDLVCDATKGCCCQAENCNNVATDLQKMCALFTPPAPTTFGCPPSPPPPPQSEPQCEKAAGGAEEDCPSPKVCGTDKKGVSAGCIDMGTCPDGSATSTELKCDDGKDNCCCKPEPTGTPVCNKVDATTFCAMGGAGAGLEECKKGKDPVGSGSSDPPSEGTDSSTSSLYSSVGTMTSVLSLGAYLSRDAFRSRA